MIYPVGWLNLGNTFGRDKPGALASRRWRKDSLDKLALKSIREFANEFWPTLPRQDKIDRQLDLSSWICTISRFNFTETKILTRPAQRDFPSGYMTTCSVTWRGQVTKRSVKTQRSATIFSHSVPLTCLTTRGETLSLLTSKFSPLLTLPTLFFLWSEWKFSKTFSIYVIANFLLRLIEKTLRHLQSLSLPKFRLLCLPIPSSCHRSLNSVG